MPHPQMSRSESLQAPDLAICSHIVHLKFVREPNFAPRIGLGGPALEV